MWFATKYSCYLRGHHKENGFLGCILYLNLFQNNSADIFWAPEKSSDFTVPFHANSGGCLNPVLEKTQHPLLKIFQESRLKSPQFWFCVKHRLGWSSKWSTFGIRKWRHMNKIVESWTLNHEQPMFDTCFSCWPPLRNISIQKFLEPLFTQTEAVFLLPLLAVPLGPAGPEALRLWVHQAICTTGG